ncbi:MAG: BolA family transcriptional regulator [Bdellovibrionales bacterium CG10_big_fil_rev_8_21_14_0_10_45_34]|nr:MAG: BolA family transcriptional regulator [Bdellovibrionales bacterium CG10_big_fil_rev_8_21_14_0_10_45_34]
MNLRANTIEKLLKQEFSPSRLEVIDESYMHSVGPDAQTHFKVVIVSKKFEGVRPVLRHAHIMNLLEKEFQFGLHALSIHAHTEAEFDPQKNTRSPKCANKR